MTRPQAPPPPPAPSWTLGALRDLAEAVLADQDVAPESGRVRTLPDERTLRYYTTLGLLSRPARMVGRTAFYGRVHLAQIVAIKKLQALNMTLAQVQAELAGATPRELELLAGLPEVLPSLPEVLPSLPPEREAASMEAAPVAIRAGAWLELAPGLVALVQGGNLPSGPALEALLEAARPLKDELRRQGLLPHPDPAGDDHA